MRRVLIVVDMQNDFVAEGGALSSPSAREIIPFVKERVQRALQADDEVIFTLDTHFEDDAEFEKFPPHCLKNSWGQELILELQELLDGQVAEQVHFVEKNRYSAFFQTDLEEYLGLIKGSKRQRVDEVELVGVCTNICVFFTAEELANRDIPTRVYAQGVASFDLDAHIFALEQMQSVLGVEVVTATSDH
ncbi:MAG: cysteine hydrolase [Firmicutes bacterium]|nr:cysteine hydrolase [Bacillota bacterium]